MAASHVSCFKPITVTFSTTRGVEECSIIPVKSPRSFVPPRHSVECHASIADSKADGARYAKRNGSDCYYISGLGFRRKETHQSSPPSITSISKEKVLSLGGIG